MSFNEQELLKVKRKTSGWFKNKVRAAIAETITRYMPAIDEAKVLPPKERQKTWFALMNQATNDRHMASQTGASSFCNPSLAASATVESWLHDLLGSSEVEIERTEYIIRELESRA